MELIVAILAGICPDWWPWGRQRRWPRWPPIPIPIPIPLPRPEPGPDPSPIDGKPQPDPWIEGKPQPDPWIESKPRPDPWILIGGILCGAGGAVAWLAVGREFGDSGSILVPAVSGFLGGTTAGWAVDSVRNMIGGQ